MVETAFVRVLISVPFVGSETLSGYGQMFVVAEL